MKKVWIVLLIIALTAGLAFAQALGDARRRGLEVRVLIDATGTRYSYRPGFSGRSRGYSRSVAPSGRVTTTWRSALRMGSKLASLSVVERSAS